MFTWICPKCGREVPPAYSDCPNCAPEAKPEAPGAQATAPVSAPPPPAAQAQEAPPPPFAAASLVVPPQPPAPAPPSSRIAVPGWLVSVMFALVFIVIGLTLIVARQARRSAPAPVESKAAQLDHAAAVSVTQTDPEFKDVELLGFRLTEDEKQKAFVRFVAVNHSGADLGEIGAKAELQAITPHGMSPVGTFAFRTSLGPWESKDVKAPLETALRVYELPDWQFLRAGITGH